MPIASPNVITVNPEAAARVGQLGMQGEFELILERTSQSTSGLRSIEVTLTPPCDPGDDPRIVLEVIRGKERGREGRESLRVPCP